MAVLTIDSIPESLSGKRNSTWQRFYTLSFRATCDSSYDGPATLRAATTRKLIGGVSTVVPWLPYIGVYYYVSPSENDLGAFCTDEDLKFETMTPPIPGSTTTPGCTWICTYQYGPYDGGAFGPDPCLWPIRLTFTAEKYQRIVLIDYNGNPILNSALCPYEDPIQVDDSRSVIKVKRNEPILGYSSNGVDVAPFDPDAAETYRDTVNLAIWNTFPAKAVKCTSISTGDEQYDSNFQRYFYEVEYEFHIDRDTWKPSILDQGYQVLDSSGLPTPLVTAEGDKIDEPVLLNGSGARLASGGTPVFTDYDTYEPLDFSAFNIDFSRAIGRS